MTHSDNRANRDLSDYLNLALRLGNLFPAVLDFETGEIGPDLWDELVGKLVDVLAEYAAEQVRSGADALQILDRKSTRLNSSHVVTSRMPSSA